MGWVCPSMLKYFHPTFCGLPLIPSRQAYLTSTWHSLLIACNMLEWQKKKGYWSTSPVGNWWNLKIGLTRIIPLMHNWMHISRQVILVCLYCDLYQLIVAHWIYSRSTGQTLWKSMEHIRHMPVLMALSMQHCGYVYLLKHMHHVLSNHACACSLH